MTQPAPLAARVACCGVTLLVVAALLAPAGFLTSNPALGLAGLVAAAILVAFTMRRRRTCSGNRHVPPAHTAEHDRPRVLPG